MTDSASVPAFGTALDNALIELEIDNHYWSSRPCGTCALLTRVLGRPFGCNRYAAIRDVQSGLLRGTAEEARAALRSPIPKETVGGNG